MGARKRNDGRVQREYTGVMPELKTLDDLGTLSSGLFMRLACGTAEVQGMEYEMSIEMSHNVMLVGNKTTGKYFYLRWEELIALARLRGIDDPHEIKH